MYRNRWRGIPFVGAPGIGKGTQARKLQAYDPAFLHIESSSMLKEFAEENPQEVRSQPIHEMFDKSGAIKHARLLTDVALFSIIQDRLAEWELQGKYFPAKQLASLDGVVRTGPQAEMFDWIIDIPACLYFDRTLISDEELYLHWKKRNRLGEDFSMFLQRVKIFDDAIPPVLEYYTKTSRLVRIDPSGSEDDVFNRVLSEMQKYRL